jgi:hypothetical protein
VLVVIALLPYDILNQALRGFFFLFLSFLFFLAVSPRVLRASADHLTSRCLRVEALAEATTARLMPTDRLWMTGRK